MARVYAAVDHADLEALQAGMPHAMRLAFGVTPGLRSLAPDEDDEGLEYLATQFAAAGATTDPIAVAVYEIADANVSPAASGAQDSGAVVVKGQLSAQDVVCFLVADPGDAVSEDADLELSWYDSSELPLVLSATAPPR